MSTPAQTAANQANAQLSTGPKTDAGKAKVSLNAVKSGLTGRTVLLPADDVAEYQLFLGHFAEAWKPVGLAESNLVQSIADAEWRLCRIPSLERGLYAIGFDEFPLPEGLAAEERQAHLSVIETRIFLKYERQFTNLSNQANRIRRHRDADIAALKELQAQRARVREAGLKKAATAYAEALRAGHAKSWNPQAIGFEFPIAEIERYARAYHPEAFQKRAA